MRANAEPVEGNRVRLSIEVDRSEVDDALDATVRRLGRQVRVPGFRPGKVPRQILEARLGGSAALRQQAINDLLPEVYAQAVADTELDPIAAPEIDVRGADEPGPLTVDAVVEVRPEVSVAGYLGLQVMVPALAVADEEVDAQIDRLRDTDGELVLVDRPAADGDFVTVDVHGTRPDGTSLDVDDYVHELGSGTSLPGLDDHLRGAQAGTVVRFSVPAAGDDASGSADATASDTGDGAPAEQGDAGDGASADATAGGTGDGAPEEHEDTGVAGSATAALQVEVTVKDVQEKRLPELTDEWVAESTEAASLEELRADLRDRLRQMKARHARMVLRERTAEALVALVSEEPPATLVDAEVDERLHDLSHRLNEQRMTLAELLARSGRDEQGLIEELRGEARRAVLLDLALRAVAQAEGIEVSEDELSRSLAEMATQVGTGPAELRRRLERAGRLSAVRSEQRKAKALRWLEENVELVDEEGAPVSRRDLQMEAEVSGPTDDEHGQGALHSGAEDASTTDDVDEQSPDRRAQEGHSVEVES